MTLLICTRQDDVTADFVILRLQKLGRSYLRFNGDELPSGIRLALGSDPGTGNFIKTERRQLFVKDIDAVWYRRRGFPTVSEVNQIAKDYIEQECLEAMDWAWKTIDAYWVSHPLDIQRAEGKLHQYFAAQALGYPVPAMLLTNSAFAARKFVEQHGTCVAKALRHKLVDFPEGTRMVATRIVELAELDHASVEAAPIILQKYVEKKFDVRVTVIGHKAFGTRIDTSHVDEAKVDWRVAPLDRVRHEAIPIPPDTEEFCIQMLDRWNLRFGAFDFAVDHEDVWHFLELNPAGQWAWIEMMTGQPLRETMIELLTGSTRA